MWLDVFSSCFIVSTWSRFKTDLSNCLFEVSLKMTSVYFRCQLLYSYELWDETTGVCPLLWQKILPFSPNYNKSNIINIFYCFSFLCVFGSGTKVGWSQIRIFSDLLIIYDMVIVWVKSIGIRQFITGSLFPSVLFLIFFSSNFPFISPSPLSQKRDSPCCASDGIPLSGQSNPVHSRISFHLAWKLILARKNWIH